MSVNSIPIHDGIMEKALTILREIDDSIELMEDEKLRKHLDELQGELNSIKEKHEELEETLRRAWKRNIP